MFSRESPGRPVDTSTTEPFKGRSVCFFAPVDDRSIIERSGFYSQDVQILSELGFDVRIATTFREIENCDLHFVWWWTWAFKPIVRNLLAKRPVLITGTFNVHTYHARTYLQKYLIKAGLKRADANVFVSEQEKSWMGQNFPSHTNHYIPHGIDTDLYFPRGNTREPFCFTTCWMALTNCKRKSMFELVSAMPKIRETIPDIRFVIAGEMRDGGPQLLDLAKRLGVDDALEMRGVVSEREKIHLMQTCKLYLQPSRYEGFGLAIAEAMACGAPVVTSAVGAVPEVVGNCGVYVDGTDPISIAKGAVELLLNPDQQVTNGREGRLRIEQYFSLDRRKQGLSEIIASII